MKLLYKYSQKGDSAANEDICGVAANSAWVMDGATDVFQSHIFEQENEVSWYMSLLNLQLKDVSYKNPFAEPKNALVSAVLTLYSSLRQQYDIETVPDYLLPTFAVAMITIESNTMHFLSLGDCSISYIHGGEVHSVIDTRIQRFSAENREKAKKHLSKTGDKNVPLTLYREIRSKANAPDGYPIGTVSGAGISNALIGEASLHLGDRILLYSDGILDYVNSSCSNLSNMFSVPGIEDEIRKMECFFNSSQEYLSRPRPKRRDDCTVLLVEV